MDYSELLERGATPAEIRRYASEGEATAITIRIPANLKDAAATEAALRGTTLSAFVRSCLIDELAREGRAR